VSLSSNPAKRHSRAAVGAGRGNPAADSLADVSKRRAATLKDVAALVGVSAATISHVINSTRRVKVETRERVFAAIEELGYSGDSIARSLRRGQTAILGLVVSDIENPYFTVLASHVQRVAALRGYQVIFANSAEQADRERESINAMRAQRVDGIILAPVAKENVEFLANQSTPLVLVNRQFSNIETCNVIVDDMYGATLGFEHLWNLGHRDIVVVHGDMDRSTTVARIAGVRNAHLQHGIEFGKTVLIDAGRSGNDGEAQLIGVLKQRPQPTAILALSNWSMLAVVKALRQGMVHCPDQVSLVGLGVTSPYWMPAASISMVEQPIAQMAHDAVELLLDQFEHTLAAKSIVLRPSFTAGLSSARVGKALKARARMSGS
jgi:LacI family transcriptional regulator